jgi:hypothetical protein
MPYLFDRSTGEYLKESGTTGKDVAITTDDSRGGLIKFDTPLQRAHNFKFEEAFVRMMDNPDLVIHYPHGRW